MSNQLRAMLASNEELTIEDLDSLKYPVWVSYKYDGYRGRVLDALVSRTGKLIPNLYTRKYLESKVGPCAALDGELTLQGNFNSVQSAFSSVNGMPDFTYWVFDCSDYPTYSYRKRYEMAKQRVADINDARIKIVPQFICSNAQEVLQIFEKVVSLGEGFDGIIIRDPSAPYKFGRSTLKQGWMLKFKPWKDAEGIIEDFEPLYTNTNDQTTDVRGYSVRSHSNEGMVALEAVGAIWLLWNGKKVKVGGGKDMTKEIREYWWRIRESLKGKKFTFKYLNLTPDGMPRHPTGRGVRLEDV